MKFAFVNISGLYIFDDSDSLKLVKSYTLNELSVPVSITSREQFTSLLIKKAKGILDDSIVLLNEHPQKYADKINQLLSYLNYDKTFFETSKSLLSSFEANSLKQLEPDKIVIQHEETLEQLIKVWNILLKRIREYLYLKDPELVVYVGDDKALINILKSNSRSKDIPKDLQVNLPADDESEFRSLVELADSVGNRIDNLKVLMETELNKLMPKTVKIATPLITAKLLFIAGSFKNLAMMPSSRIQLLGAEKALFRFLRSGNKMPKYGVLFQHPEVLEADKKSRGKVARKLAAKISIALKQDYFGNKNEQ